MMSHFPRLNMLSESALRFVQENKIWGTGAFLQSAFLNFGACSRNIQHGKPPPKETLEEVWQQMTRMRTAFDMQYVIGSPPEMADILGTEAEAWRLLSPRVQSFLERFQTFIASYSVDTSASSVAEYLQEYWSLIQQWNTLSNSYKAKEQDGDVQSTEKTCQELIATLRMAATDTVS